MTTKFAEGWLFVASLVCISAICAVLAWSVNVLLPNHPSQAYPLFIVVFAGAALLVDRRAGFIAVSLSALLLAYVNLEGEAFAVAKPDDALGLIFLIFSGVFIVQSIGSLTSLLRRRTVEHEMSSAGERRLMSLLKEISHRFLNDLQSLSSIARLQATRSGSDDVRASLDSIAARIQILGEIYARLSLSSSDADLQFDMKPYLVELCYYFHRVHIQLRPIRLSVDAVHCNLSMHRAVLVGLVLHECLTNVVKYAFPDEQSGQILVDFRDDRERSGWLVLTVTDDGRGFQAGEVKGTGLGGTIVRALASQLGGDYSLQRIGASTVGRLSLPERSASTAP